MGQIRKRGTFYQIRYYRRGQLIEETTEHTKWEDARTLLQKREGAIADGVPITARSTRLTFDDAIKDVIADYAVNVRKSKGHVERRNKLHLTPYFGGKTLASITAADVRAYAAARLEATGHKTEAVYRRYAITSESDLREGVERLNGASSRLQAASANRESA
jgi:hypothetical protein